MSAPKGGLRVYLAYLDDSGSDAKSPVALVGAVVIDDALFAHLEDLLGLVVELVLPEERRASFQEFHSTDLYWGHNAFQGIDEWDRYQAIRNLLGIISTFKVPFVYSAVDRKLLALSPMGSSHPIDVAFRMCALGIQDWLKQPALRKPIAAPLPQGHSADPLCLFIADDTAEGALKKTLRTSFKALRHRRVHGGSGSRLPLVHDDMYFGSSADSIGIQLADLCSFFMMRHLRDGVTDEFYELFCHQARCAEPSPEWGQYRDLFRKHRRDSPERRSAR